MVECSRAIVGCSSPIVERSRVKWSQVDPRYSVVETSRGQK